MKVFTKTVLTISVLISFSFSSFAQFKSNGYEIGINTGTLIYQGELTPKFYGYTKSLKPVLGLYVSKSLSPYFSLRGNLTAGKILADESQYANPEWRQYRNFKFNSRLTELTGNLVFTPYGQNNEYNAKRLSPYVFVGVGFTFLNVKRDWSGFNTTVFDAKSTAALSLAADTIHSTPRVVPVIPLGVGLKYILSPRLALNAEATWRLTSSDYIDGFKYADNKNNRDSYYGISIGLSFKFGSNRYNCPKVK